MKIGSIIENLDLERRVAITPEIAKKFISNGFEINLQKNYAKHLGIEDKDFEELNVKFFENEKLVIENSEILAQLNLPSKSTLGNMDQNKIIIGILNPYQNKEELDELVKKKNYMFFVRVTSKNYKSSVYGCAFFTGKFGRL